jgi:hypothetical protein
MNGNKLRNLDPCEVDSIIESLPATHQQKVKKNAVLNFLMSVAANETRQNALMNMLYDARSYGWNQQTQRVIALGIEAATKRNNE